MGRAGGWQVIAIPKTKEYRNKALMSVVHELNCVWCGRIKNYTQAAHGGSKYGKSGARKASDAAVAALCGGIGTPNGGCHYAVDAGRHLSRADREAMLDIAIVRTYQRLQLGGWIRGAVFFDAPPDVLAPELVKQMEAGSIEVAKGGRNFLSL